MMKSLSRLFGGGKSGKKAEVAASEPVPNQKPARPVATRPHRPVEVMAPDRGPAKPAGDAMFDSEAPLSTDPIRRRTNDTPHAASAGGDSVELEDLIDETRAEAAGSEPVAIRRLDDDDDDADPGDTMQALSGRKSKQEMLNQLRKNYDEVLGIVRKVDQHLDEQAHRSERMLEIAERTALHLEKLGHLEDLNERQRETVDAVTRLVEITKEGNENSASSATQLMRAASDQLEQQREQTSTLHDVKTAVDRAGERDQEMADSIKGFTDTIGGVKTATSELGSAITSMRDNDAERERELAQIVARSQRWLIVTVVVVGVVAVGALTAVIMAAF